MVGLGELLLLALNQSCRLQFRQHTLGSSRTLVEHFCNLLNQEYDINSSGLVRPFVELGQPRLVKQTGIGQFGGKGQLHLYQESGEKEIRWQFGSCCHVDGMGLLAVVQEQAVPAIVVTTLMHQPPGCAVLLIGHVRDFG